jgi:hypothetical protein
VESVSGFEYYLVCLDDFTQYAWVFPLLSKSEAFTHLSSLHALALTQFHASFQAIQCDNGREFDNSVLHSFAQQHGITLLFFMSIYFPTKRQSGTNHLHSQQHHSHPPDPS